jgi:multiple antibiotic resistance protein
MSLATGGQFQVRSGLHRMAPARRPALAWRSPVRGSRGCIVRRNPIPTFVNAIALTIGALLPIMNPFSTAPLFVSLTASFDPARRRSQALKACIYAFAILVVFLLAGAAIVDFFGISIPGIRSAGGLIILAIGFRMLFPAPKPTGDADAPAAPDLDVAFSPLAMPSLAGPGSIAVVMSAAAQIRSEHAREWMSIYVAVIAGMAVTLIFSYLVLRVAGTMVRFMGREGIDAMTRIFGFLLICIGMQFLLTGVADFYGVRLGAAPAVPV